MSTFERVATNEQIEFVKECIAEDNVGKFYNRSSWLRAREKVMALDHHQCVRCKKLYGRYRKANVVHHVHHLKDRPDLCLNVYDEQGERNLISLCNSCHDEVHPEKQVKFKISAEERRRVQQKYIDDHALTKEKW